MYLNKRTAGQENLPDQTNRAYPSVYPRKEKKLPVIKNNTQFQEIKFSIGSKDVLMSYSEYNYSPSETTLWAVITWRDGKIWPTVASAARGKRRWKRKTAPITFAVSLKVKITVLLDIPVFPHRTLWWAIGAISSTNQICISASALSAFPALVVDFVNPFLKGAPLKLGESSCVYIEL